MSSSIKAVLGISWDPNCVTLMDSFQKKELRIVLFRLKKILPDFVFCDARLEENPLTFSEVKTLMDGVSIGGRKISDVEQVLSLKRAWSRLALIVSDGSFGLTKEIFCEVNALVAFEESLEWGKFRTGNLVIGGTSYNPPRWEELPDRFARGIEVIESIDNPLERAMAFSLWTAREQFFFDGNKRTGRIMMSGELMKNGFDAVSIPDSFRLEFNEKMLRFYDSGDATEMMKFYKSLIPDLE